MKLDSSNAKAVRRNQVQWRHLVSVILWAALFTLAYAQAPLYTSNQNQYFLHGYAQAGVGFLNQDWLANTLDPTPVFSQIIHLTARYLPWPPIFYLYYTILAGIYLFSLYGILAEIFKIKNSIPRRWLYLSVLTLAHSAAIRYLLVRVFNPGWAFLLDGGVAGQRLLGSVLQPSTFGVLLISSIYFFLRGKYTWTIFCLIFAPTVHPTYLFSAALLTLTYMGITYAQKRSLKTPLAIGLSALLGVMPILILSFRTFGGTEAWVTDRSRDILVSFRIPHHAIPAEWLDGTLIIKAAIILIALYLTRKTSIFHILSWPLAAAVLGTLLQIFTGSNVISLLFPWRVSTWLVPLSLGIVIVGSLEKIWPIIQRQTQSKTLIVSGLTLALLLAGAGLTKTILEYHEKKNGLDRAMMAFTEKVKSPGDVYLIPLDMQDFRLETGVPAYVEFKSIPYKDVDVLEWYRRVSKAGSLYRAPTKRTGCQILAELHLEGVTHAVLPYDHTVQNCENLEPLYTDLNYQVFKILGANGLREFTPMPGL